MGLSESEFWNLTPGLLVLLMGRWRDDQIRLDRRSGEVVAILWNINRDPKKDPTGKTWLDVYPEHRDDAYERKERQQTDADMALSLKMWAAVVNRQLERKAAKA